VIKGDTEKRGGGGKRKGSTVGVKNHFVMVGLFVRTERKNKDINKKHIVQYKFKREEK
jgi:hypothetical protein